MANTFSSEYDSYVQGQQRERVQSDGDIFLHVKGTYLVVRLILFVNANRLAANLPIYDAIPTPKRRRSTAS